MEKTRFHVGMENLKKIDGKGGEAVIQSLETISPDLGKYIVEFAFGDIYERDGLSLQERDFQVLHSTYKVLSLNTYKENPTHYIFDFLQDT